MFLQVVRTPIVIVNSAEVAFDLMEKRSNIYSDKPHSTIDELSVITKSFAQYRPHYYLLDSGGTGILGSCHTANVGGIGGASSTNTSISVQSWTFGMWRHKRYGNSSAGPFQMVAERGFHGPPYVSE